MPLLTHYELLGVDKNATNDDISNACMHALWIWNRAEHLFEPQLFEQFSALKKRYGEAISELFSEASRKVYNESFKASLSVEQEHKEQHLRSQHILFSALFKKYTEVEELQVGLSENQMMVAQLSEANGGLAQESAYFHNPGFFTGG